MSFASEPGRDDGNLPPVNIVIPDDARELDRDVLAYRRELRAKRRRQRLLRLFRPFRARVRRARGDPPADRGLPRDLPGRRGAAVGHDDEPGLGADAERPASVRASPPVARRPDRAAGGHRPARGRTEPVRSLVSSAIALVPANCGCGAGRCRLAGQAVAAHVSLYFAGTGQAITQCPPSSPATVTARRSRRRTTTACSPSRTTRPA